MNTKTEQALFLVGRECPTTNREVVKALATLREAIEDRDRLQHIIDCANTPLMAEVLKERDELKAELARYQPLIEAVEKARTVWVAHPPTSSYQPPIEVREFDQVGDKAILRAALKARESK